MSDAPACVLVFSGKRKSGKDYVTSLLIEKLDKGSAVILRLSGPLKGQYAKDHNLDFEKLLDASEYKEKYRADMIAWGEEQRQKDPGYFCRLATHGPEASCPVWIISDARRLTDIAYFTQNYADKLLKVRVQASEETRRSRGWVFTPEVDDAESECGLDTGVDWDVVVSNDGDTEQLERTINKILKYVHTKLNTKQTG